MSAAQRHIFAKDDAVARRKPQYHGLDSHQRRRQEPRAPIHELQIDFCAAAARQHAAEFHEHGEADAADGFIDVAECDEDVGADDARDGKHVGGGPC